MGGTGIDRIVTGRPGVKRSRGQGHEIGGTGIDHIVTGRSGVKRSRGQGQEVRVTRSEGQGSIA